MTQHLCLLFWKTPVCDKLILLLSVTKSYIRLLFTDVSCQMLTTSPPFFSPLSVTKFFAGSVLIDVCCHRCKLLWPVWQQAAEAKSACQTGLSADIHVAWTKNLTNLHIRLLKIPSWGECQHKLSIKADRYSLLLPFLNYKMFWLTSNNRFGPNKLKEQCHKIKFS